MMRAGSLDTTITIQRGFQIGETPLNEPITEWRTHVTARAKVAFDEGDEEFAMSQRYTTQAITLTIRWHPDIQTTDRVLMDGRYYDIKAVRPAGKRRREAIELKCEFTQ